MLRMIEYACTGRDRLAAARFVTRAGYSKDPGPQTRREESTAMGYLYRRMFPEGKRSG